MFAALETEFHGTADARGMAIEALFCLILVPLHRGLARRTAKARAMPDWRFELVRRFEAMVDCHPAANRSVAEYAPAPHVTSSHLSRLGREATGRGTVSNKQSRKERGDRRA